MNPDISIIIPFFNSAATLQRSVQSVIGLDFSDWELILINDGSNDNSRGIAEKFIIDSRIKLFSQTNKGVSAARNLGAANATGEWLIFLDSDDEFTKDALSFYCKSILTNPSKSVFAGGLSIIKGDIKTTKMADAGVYNAKIPGTYCLKKSLFQELNGFDIRLKFSENTELFHRVRLHGYNEIIIKREMILYYDSLYGGSRNLQNMIDSNLLILEKHNTTLSDHTKHLYHQVIGVNQLRFRRFPEARKHLWKAYSLKPSKISTLGRLLISLSTALAKKLYTPEVPIS